MAAAAGYVSNWWLIAQHSSYFARFGPPSPLGHLWSLAVEEQFYLIWPWLLLHRAALRRPAGGVGHGSPQRRWRSRPPLAAEMALLYQPGYDPDARLRRHRYPRVRAPDRCGASLRVA